MFLSLKDAKIEFARKRLKLLDHYDLYPELLAQSSEDDKNQNEFEKSIYEEREKLERDIKRYSKYLLSFPHIRPFIKLYMVDIKFGSEIPYSNKKFDECNLEEEVLDVLIKNPEEFTNKTAGNLISQIGKELYENFGLIITDRGFGCGGGHIGCPCTENEKNLVIDYIWTKYRKAIDSELIFPIIAFVLSQPHFQDIWDRKEIEDFLQGEDQ